MQEKEQALAAKLVKNKVLVLSYAIILFSIPIAFVLIVRLSSFLHIGLVALAYILAITLIFDLSRSVGKGVILPLEELRRRLRPAPPLSRVSRFSVIIPAHNEETNLGNTIESVLENDLDGGELIVVDDGSSDLTLEIASKYRGRRGVKVVHRERSGLPAYAINYGSLFSEGDTLLFMDADTILGRDALSRTAKYFEDSRVVGACGNLRVLNADRNLLTRLQSYEYLVSFEMGRRIQAMFNSLVVAPGALSAVRSDVFRSIGKYDATLCQDLDESLKLTKLRGKVRFMPDVLAWTEVPSTWRAWRKQRTRWAKGEVRCFSRHRNLFFRRRFGVGGMFGAPDMVLMDIVALLVRPVGFLLIGTLLTSWINLVIILGAVYLYSETIQALGAFGISNERGEMRNILVFPLAIIYRTIYAPVRFISYVLYQKGEEWEA